RMREDEPCAVTSEHSAGGLSFGAVSHPHEARGQKSPDHFLAGITTKIGRAVNPSHCAGQAAIQSNMTCPRYPKRARQTLLALSTRSFPNEISMASGAICEIFGIGACSLRFQPRVTTSSAFGELER